MIRVAFLNPTIPPRVIALLNRINIDKSVEVKGFFFAESQKNRNWNLSSKEYETITFKYTILKSFSIGFGITDFHTTFISSDLWFALTKYNPDIVLLPGWADLNSYVAIVWAKFHRKKIILRTESTQEEKSWRRNIFLPITLISCRASDAIIGSSKRATRYAQTLVRGRIFATIRSSFDTVSFANKVAWYSKKKAQHKKELGITHKKVVYFNGQLIKRKGIVPLLAAFQQKELSHVALLITGTGRMHAVVQEATKNTANIYYHGYQTQDILPRYYAVADYFILPSYEETWGLVTVEALAAGLPIIISSAAGSSELITDEIGVLLNKITSKHIVAAVLELSQKSVPELEEISSKCQKIAIKELSYEKVASDFVKVFKKLSD